MRGLATRLEDQIIKMWIDPHETGVYVGQCAQYCRTQHAKMLISCYEGKIQGFRAFVRTTLQLSHNHVGAYP